MAFTCPECGQSVGHGTPQDALGHLRHCLHVENQSLESLERMYSGMPSGMDVGHVERVEVALAMARKDRESAVDKSDRSR